MSIYKNRTDLFIEAQQQFNKGVSLDIACSNHRDDDRESLLAYVARKNDTPFATWLLEHGAQPDFIPWFNISGHTALHVAVVAGHYQMAGILINYGANIHYRQRSTQKTLLHLATEKGYTKLAKLLIDRGVDVHAKDSEGKSALHYAVMHYHMGMITLLLDKGANINNYDKNKNTPIYAALLEANHILSFGNYSEFAFDINRSQKVTVNIIILLLQRGANNELKEMYNNYLLKALVLSSDLSTNVKVAITKSIYLNTIAYAKQSLKLENHQTPVAELWLRLGEKNQTILRLLTYVSSSSKTTNLLIQKPPNLRKKLIQLFQLITQPLYFYQNSNNSSHLLSLPVEIKALICVHLFSSETLTVFNWLFGEVNTTYQSTEKLKNLYITLLEKLSFLSLTKNIVSSEESTVTNMKGFETSVRRV